MSSHNTQFSLLLGRGQVDAHGRVRAVHRRVHLALGHDGLADGGDDGASRGDGRALGLDVGADGGDRDQEGGHLGALGLDVGTDGLHQDEGGLDVDALDGDGHAGGREADALGGNVDELCADGHARGRVRHQAGRKVDARLGQGNAGDGLDDGGRAVGELDGRTNRLGVDDNVVLLQLGVQGFQERRVVVGLVLLKKG